jgi:ComF family protein
MALGLARTLLDFIFPPRCAACGAIGAEFCASCAAKVRPPPAPRCVRCDRPLGEWRGATVAARGLCRECAAGAFAPALDRIVTAAVYEEPLRAALLALKFKGRRRAAIPLAGLALDAWRASGLRADVIVPLPLHRTRSRQRGYNQTELLARELARASGPPARTDILTRTRATAAQANLGWSERQVNVAGAFALLPAAEALAGRRVLLLDDIITSGATIQAAASALRQANPAAIYALAVAHPLPQEG